jgi:hypothetical protein
MRDPSVLTKARQAPNRPVGIYYSPLTTNPVSICLTRAEKLAVLSFVALNACLFSAGEEVHNPKPIDPFFAYVLRSR